MRKIYAEHGIDGLSEVTDLLTNPKNRYNLRRTLRRLSRAINVGDRDIARMKHGQEGVILLTEPHGRRNVLFPLVNEGVVKLSSEGQIVYPDDLLSQISAMRASLEGVATIAASSSTHVGG